jgi:hypothetical protein
MVEETKKETYEKPKMTVEKITPFFFNCLQKISKCTTRVKNNKVGKGCPRA